MSWDIFVQDIPADAQSVRDIADDFRPRPIGSRAHVLATIRATAPFADFSDPACIHIDAPGVDIEVSVGQEDPLPGFAFHVHGGEQSAGVVADILQRLQMRAFDPASKTGIFDILRSTESFRRWQQYRDHVLDSPNA